jgi:chromosome segregation ATPase
MSENKKKELVIVEPKEFNIEPTKAISIQSSFMPKVAERDGYVAIYKELLSREISKDLVGEAGELRRKLVKVRTGIADIHKTEKSFYLQAGRFVDALKNALTLPVTQMEEKLSEVENHFEEIERKEKEARIEARKSRIAEISNELDIPDFEFVNLSDDSFDLFLSGIKQRHEDRIAAEVKAEKDRVAAEKAEAAERKRICLENEKLRADAAKREKEIQKELDRKAEELEAERKAFDEKIEAERAKAKAEAERIDRINNTKLKAEREAKQELEAERKAKQDAEDKLANDAKLAEQKALQDSEKAAKAPLKEQLTRWIDDFNMPPMPVLNDKTELISNKFSGFKTWAKSEIEKM